MIITLCLNPTVQKTLLFKKFVHGEVNRAIMQRTDASGKGVNVSRVLSQLGCQVLHITQLGGKNRAWFTDMLLEDGIPLRCVPSGTEIRGCCTVLEQNPFCMTELVEEGDTVRDETEVGIRQAFFDAINTSDAQAVIISGSKAQGFSASLFPDLARMALERDLLCVADYRGTDLRNTLENCAGLANGKLIIKPNFEEFCESFFVDCTCDSINENQLKDKMRAVYAAYGAKSIITHGSEPLTAYDGTNFYTLNCASLPEGKTVQNTIGCGDAFTAGFTAKIILGSTFAHALEEANRCGALNAATIKPGSLL